MRERRKRGLSLFRHPSLAGGAVHGIGPNVACPTDSLYKLQLMHLGQAEETGGLGCRGRE